VDIIALSSYTVLQFCSKVDEWIINHHIIIIFAQQILLASALHLWILSWSETTNFFRRFYFLARNSEAKAMPEVYVPAKKRRGTASVTGIFRRVAKKPYWPGLDMEGRLLTGGDSAAATNQHSAVDESSNHDVFALSAVRPELVMVLQKDATGTPANDDPELSFHLKGSQDDPILSFDDDALVESEVTNHHNGAAKTQTVITTAANDTNTTPTTDGSSIIIKNNNNADLDAKPLADNKAPAQEDKSSRNGTNRLPRLSSGRVMTPRPRRRKRKHENDDPQHAKINTVMKKRVHASQTEPSNAQEVKSQPMQLALSEGESMDDKTIIRTAKEPVVTEATTVSESLNSGGAVVSPLGILHHNLPTLDQVLVGLTNLRNTFLEMLSPAYEGMLTADHKNKGSTAFKGEQQQQHNVEMHKLQELCERQERAVERMENLQLEMRTENNRRETLSQEALAELTGNIKAMREERSAVESKLAEAEQMNRRLTVEVQDKDQTIQDLQESVESTRKVLQSRVDEQFQQLNQRNGIISAKDREIEELKKKIAKLSQRNTLDGKAGKSQCLTGICDLPSDTGAIKKQVSAAQKTASTSIHSENEAIKSNLADDRGLSEANGAPKSLLTIGNNGNNFRFPWTPPEIFPNARPRSHQQKPIIMIDSP
jgi:hypothetical protein